MSSLPIRRVPFGTLVVLLPACALYAVMLANISYHSGSGDAAFGEAFLELVLVFGLWVMLAILLIVGGVAGEMPRWAALVLVVLHPLSGGATFAAIDMCSRRMAWATAFVVVLPALTAMYALWARFRSLHKAFLPTGTSVTALGGILGLSAVALMLAGSL